MTYRDHAMPSAEFDDDTLPLTDATPNPNWFLRARLKTRQLLLIIAIDDERNIHRAADVLCMTQPAASKQLKDLEDMLEVRLFDRHARGMVPTLYGETMIRHARMALSSLAAAHDDIVALKHGVSGRVEVGAIMTPAITLLPQAIAQTKEESPQLRIGIVTDSSKALLDGLRRGVLDFVIGRLLDAEDGSDLRYESITNAPVPVCAVARSDHPLFKAGALDLHDLTRYPWVLPPPGNLLRHRWEQMFQRAGLDLPVSLAETNIQVLVQVLLMQTDALHVMPLEVAQSFVGSAGLAIVPMRLPCHMDAFGLITRSGHLLSPGARRLLHHVRAMAAEIYADPAATTDAAASRHNGSSSLPLASH